MELEPNHFIYGQHLQIVQDSDIHDAFVTQQLIQFPKSILVTPSTLQLLHEGKMREYCNIIHQKHPNAVWYLLPEGTYNALEGYNCNGIRYGTHLSDYISLPQIKLTGDT